MFRHELAIDSHSKSNAKIHELEVYSQQICSSYILTFTSLSTFSLVRAINVLYSLNFTKYSDILNKNT